MKTKVKDMVIDIVQDLNRGADLSILKKKYSFKIDETHRGRNFTLYHIFIPKFGQSKIIYITQERRWYPAC